MHYHKFTIFLLVFLFIYGCSSTKSFVGDPERLKQLRNIAVLPFRCEIPEIGITLAEALSARMILSPYNIIERSQFERILEEHDLTMSGVVNNPSLVVGKIEGVDAIIVGSVTVDRGFAGIAYGGYRDYISSSTARIIDIETGQVLMAATYRSSGASTQRGAETPSDVGERLAKELGAK